MKRESSIKIKPVLVSWNHPAFWSLDNWTPWIICQIGVIQAASFSFAICITETMLPPTVVAFVQSGHFEPWRIWKRESWQVTAGSCFQAWLSLGSVMVMVSAWETLVTLYHFPSSTSCISEIWWSVQLSLKRPHRDGMVVLKKGNLKSRLPQENVLTQCVRFLLLAFFIRKKRKKKTNTETVFIGVVTTDVFLDISIYKISRLLLCATHSYGLR